MKDNSTEMFINDSNSAFSRSRVSFGLNGKSRRRATPSPDAILLALE